MTHIQVGTYARTSDTIHNPTISTTTANVCSLLHNKAAPLYVSALRRESHEPHALAPVTHVKGLERPHLRSHFRIWIKTVETRPGLHVMIAALFLR